MNAKNIVSALLVLITISVAAQPKADAFLSDRIILKIKPALKENCFRSGIGIESVNRIFEDFGVSGVEQKFPKAINPRFTGSRETDITTIYSVIVPAGTDLQQLIEMLSSLPETEYAQLHYLPELFYQPNDPFATSNQWYLTNVQAYDAWDICQGDSSIIIGITDTGIDYGHSDLVDNCAYNLNDIINGIDDDHDGFTDNFRGWDLGDNDNSAQWNDATGTGNLNHGVYVTGAAAPSTNNGTGVAGIAFKCRYLPVKINDYTGLLVASYESIVYAADHGCRIINCSWGGNSRHPYGQDIVNYATFNRHALVIAAAGNNGNISNDVYYPCAYDNVLCVGASSSSDERWYKSCYGHHLDLTAPGVSIYAPGPNQGYDNNTGTSFASPVTASVAALVLAHHNDTLSPQQLSFILKNSCDYIDTLPANQAYAGKLGTGRINAYNALTQPLSPALSFENFAFTENALSDTAYITGELWNYLAPAYNTTVLLTAGSTYIEIIQGQRFIDTLRYNEYVSFTSSPFSIRILPGIPYDQSVEFLLRMITGNDTTDQYFTVTLNLSYYDFTDNNFKTTLCANGRIGYSSIYPLLGEGMRYKNSRNILSDGGFIMAYAPTKTISSVYNRSDFGVVSPVTQIIPGTADKHFVSEFNDSKAPDSVKLGFRIRQEVFAWDDPDASDFCIVRYTLVNTQGLPASNVYAGMFFDWDVVNPALNTSQYYPNRKLSVARYQGVTTLLAGVIQLSYHPSNHYSFDRVQGGNGGIDIYYDYTAQELHSSLIQNRYSAGFPNGSDISFVTGYGPFYILPGDSVTFDYALLAAESDYLMEQIADTALSYYTQYINNNPETAVPSEIQIWPNPATDKVFISGLPEDCEISIYSTSGICHGKYKAAHHQTTIGTANLPAGIYMVQITSGIQTARTKLIKH